MDIPADHIPVPVTIINLTEFYHLTCFFFDDDNSGTYISNGVASLFAYECYIENRIFVDGVQLIS